MSLGDRRGYRIIDVTECLIEDINLCQILNRAGCSTNLPWDAQIIDIHRDFNRQVWQLLLESPEWEPVPEGYQIPRFDVIIEKQRQDLPYLWRRTLRATGEALVRQVRRAREQLLRGLNEL